MPIPFLLYRQIMNPNGLTLLEKILQLPKDAFQKFSTRIQKEYQHKKEAIQETQSQLASNLKISIAFSIVTFIAGVSIALILALSAPYLVLIAPAIVGGIALIALGRSFIWRWHHRADAKQCDDQLAEINKQELQLFLMEANIFEHTVKASFFGESRYRKDNGNQLSTTTSYVGCQLV